MGRSRRGERRQSPGENRRDGRIRADRKAPAVAGDGKPDRRGDQRQQAGLRGQVGETRGRHLRGNGNRGQRQARENVGAEVTRTPAGERPQDDPGAPIAGGRGGDVVIECADGLNTLIDFRYQQHFKAKTGMHGMGRNMTGAKGADVTLKVPAGTQVFAEDNETLICDLTIVGQRFLLAKGGNGGFGNAHFKTSTNRAPRNANPGQPGEERWIWLRLKLIADIGLAGLPNAGKSTFLSAASAAKPKIADYPFTTLAPNLGMVDLSPSERFVIADIPGLIRAASR